MYMNLPLLARSSDPGSPSLSAIVGHTFGNYNLSPRCPGSVDGVPTLDSLIQQASRLYSDGKPSEALKIYDELTQLDQANNVLYANRSAILIKLGRWGEALADADRAVELEPTWAKAHFRRGDSLKGTGELTPALVAYARAVSLDRSDAGNEQFQREFIHCASRILRASPETFVPMFNEPEGTYGERLTGNALLAAVGDAILKSGDTTARRAATEILELASAQATQLPIKLRVSTLSTLFSACWEDGDWKGVSDVGRKLLQHGGGDNAPALTDKAAWRLHRLLAEVAIHHTLDSASAIEHLGKAIELCFDSGGCRKELEQLRLSLTEQLLLTKCSTANYERGILDRSGGFESQMTARLVGVKYLLADGEITVALEAIRELVKELEADEGIKSIAEKCQALALLTDCHMAIGDWSRAYECAKRELAVALSVGELGPQLHSMLNLSQLYTNAGKWEESVNMVEEVLRLASAQRWKLEALRVLGRAHLANAVNNGESRRRDAAENAVACFTEAIHSLPRSSPAELIEVHLELSSAYRLLGSGEEHELEHLCAARSQIDALKTSYPKGSPMLLESHLLCALGECQMAGGKFDEAKSAWEEALIIAQELNNCRMEALLCEKLGEMHLDGLGNIEAAIVYSQQSLAVYRQLRSVRPMLRIYEKLARAYSIVDADSDEAKECSKYSTTLTELMKKVEKMDGRTFSSADIVG